MTATSALLIGCGDDTPARVTAPTSIPAPAPTPPAPSVVEIRGTITDTVTGAVLGPLERTVPRLPARLDITHSGYVTRSAWITTTTPRVDLIPERGFDLRFYRQLARGIMDQGGSAPVPLRVLEQAPSFYIEVEGDKGLPRQLAARLEQVARRIVPLITGGRFQVTRWETGPTARPRQTGWIIITRKDEPGVCGRAYIGAADGLIELGLDTLCEKMDGVFAHELGHAFGFSHTDRPGSMLFPREAHTSATDAPTDIERHHMALAYARPRGNRDVDVDPDGRSALMPSAVVD